MLESLLFVYQTSQSEYAFRLGVNTFQEEESKREERVRTEDNNWGFALQNWIRAEKQAYELIFF